MSKSKKIDLEQFANTGLLFKILKGLMNPEIRYIILSGGARSGKTWAILQALALYSFFSTKQRSVISIVSISYPHLRRGAIRDAQQIWNVLFGGGWARYWKETTKQLILPGGIIEFFSCDDIAKVHGSQRDIIYLNEVQFIDYEVARHLLVRTSGKVLMDFNPIRKLWVHSLKDDEKTLWVDSTYRENKFLSSAQVAEMERQRTNAAWWRVYGEGEIGGVEGVVYPEFSIINENEMPEWSCIGVDFGYSNSPTAVLAVAIRDNSLYIRQLVYQVGLRVADLVELLKMKGVTPGVELFCDSAEPRMIDELYYAGFNAKPVIKTNVEEGVELVRKFNLHVTRDSVDVINELGNYTFSTDKEGNYTNRPVKSYDHAMDALRYAVTMHELQKMKKEYTFIPQNRMNKL